MPAMRPELLAALAPTGLVIAPLERAMPAIRPELPAAGVEARRQRGRYTLNRATIPFKSTANRASSLLAAVV